GRAAGGARAPAGETDPLDLTELIEDPPPEPLELTEIEGPEELPAKPAAVPPPAKAAQPPTTQPPTTPPATLPPAAAAPPVATPEVVRRAAPAPAVTPPPEPKSMSQPTAPI